MLRFATLLLGFLAGPVQGEHVTPAAFEKMTAGRAFLFTEAGRPMGYEIFGRARNVYWVWANGGCHAGKWREVAQESGARTAICFFYNGIEIPQCWRYTLEQGQLVATNADPLLNVVQVAHPVAMESVPICDSLQLSAIQD